MAEATVPAMGELLKDSPKNWGKWGPDDEIGGLNYLGAGAGAAGGPARQAGQGLHAAGGDVRPGGRPGVARPPRCREDDDRRRGRAGSATRRPQFPGGLHYADDFITAFLQGSTQYDALGHVWYDGEIYNGYDATTTIGGLTKASVVPDRRAWRRRPGHPDRHGPPPRQGQPRQGRDVHPRGPRGDRRGAGRRDRAA